MIRFRPLTPATAAAAVALAALCAPAFAERGASSAKEVKVRAHAAASKCRSAALYADRQLQFRGTMWTLPGVAKMQMRVVLLRRYMEQRRWRVVAPGTDARAVPTWYENTEPNAVKYVHTFDVVPVETRAQYKARVYYRWRDAEGKIIAKAKRSSRVCNQTRKLSDLVVERVQRLPNVGDRFPELPTRYVVTVRNIGASTAHAGLQQWPTLTGSLNGTSLVEGTQRPAITLVDPLPPKATTEYEFFGPQCTGGLNFSVNGDRLVRESNYGNNSLIETC